MATPQEIEDQQDAVRAKRAAIAAQVAQLNVQHSTSNSALLGHDFAAMDKIRFNSALKPLLMQDRILHQQEQQLSQALNRGDREASRAITDQNAAARATVAAQKAQVAAKKQAATDLEDNSARAFGLGPKKGIDYVNQQGAFYDPARGQIAVPDTKSAKAATQKAQKGDAQAGKQVQAELSGFAKQAGVQGPVHAASFFGDNGFEMEPDKDGNYVYDANGTQVTIPEETAKRLQEQYNSSLAPVQEDAQLPTTGVKYIPVDTFQQANQTLSQVKGVPVPNPVDRFLASNQAMREAQPAIDAAVAAKAAGVRPTTVPSANQVGGLGYIGGARGASTDISTGVRILDQAAYNQSGVDPIFEQIRDRNKAVALAPISETSKRAGGVAPNRVKEITSDVIERMGADATPEQIGIATKAALDQEESRNRAPGSGYDALAKGASIVGRTLLTDFENTQPQIVIGNQMQRGMDYLGPKASSYLGGILDALPTDRSLPQKMDELQKRFAIDKGTGAIPASTKQEDYVNFFLNGPQPTNPDSARYVPPTE